MHPVELNQDSKGGFWKLSISHFLIALILLILASPYVLDSTEGKLIEATLMTLVFLSAVLAVGGRHRSLYMAALLVTPAIAGTWLDHFLPNFWLKEWTMTAAIIFASFVILNLLRYIMRAPQVDFQVLCAGISSYLMLALLWTFAYLLVDRLFSHAFVSTVTPEHPESLAAFDAMYFSFCTLTTVGYGDIVPKAKVARQLAMLEATTGTLFITILIARLVSLYSPGKVHTSHNK